MIQIKNFTNEDDVNEWLRENHRKKIVDVKSWGAAWTEANKHSGELGYTEFMIVFQEDGS